MLRYRLFLAGLIVNTFITVVQADPPAETVGAIRKLGGTIRPLGTNPEEWEVAFHLRGRSLTDEGLAQIAGLKNVVYLNLAKTKITGRGLVHLKGLTQLRILHLEMTNVDDAGIAHLAGLDNLEYLNLYLTKVTDKSLAHLKGMKKLKKLYVWQTKITDSGVENLKKSLPQLKVVRGVDLSKLPVEEPVRPSEKPVAVKWQTDLSKRPAKSKLGSNMTITFVNKRKHKVKLHWVTYAGGLKEYAVLEPGASRRQNSFSEAVWLVTTEEEKPLGYFITIQALENHAVIPAEG